MIGADRYHDISCGHRVHGHEGKCHNLHGHNYRVHFECRPIHSLDKVGRVLDFSNMKARLCMWLEDHWDHKFLVWQQDDYIHALLNAVSSETAVGVEPVVDMLKASLVWVPFNPTAENMAHYLLTVIGPRQLEGTGVELTAVRIEETRKCGAYACLD